MCPRWTLPAPHSGGGPPRQHILTSPPCVPGQRTGPVTYKFAVLVSFPGALRSAAPFRGWQGLAGPPSGPRLLLPHGPRPSPSPAGQGAELQLSTCMHAGLATAPSRPLGKGEPRGTPDMPCPGCAARSLSAPTALCLSPMSSQCLNALLWAARFWGGVQRKGPIDPLGSIRSAHVPRKGLFVPPLFITQAHVLEAGGSLGGGCNLENTPVHHTGPPRRPLCPFPFNQSSKLNPLWAEGGTLNFTCLEV